MQALRFQHLKQPPLWLLVVLVDEGEALGEFLKRLSAVWVKSIPGAPHVAAGDPDQDLLHVLGMDASSTVFDGRDVLGEFFVTNWQIWNGMPD